MPTPKPTYHFHPLGDQAVLIRFSYPAGAALSNYILAVYERLRQPDTHYITDLVPAYDSLTVFYSFQECGAISSTEVSVYAYICNRLAEWIAPVEVPSPPQPEDIIRIPICYEEAFAPDIGEVAKTKHLSVPEVIREHTDRLYRVYMIGFLPGFPYMGEVHDSIVCPRKSKPQPVKAGSVGIAGTQTGVYPLDSPGGWQIIGCTPVKMFNPNQANPVLLQPGDTVQFYPITAHEYHHY